MTALSPDDVLAAARVALGAPAVVRDANVLASACARPDSGFGEHREYPTVSLKAAALLHALIRSHPLADGNKRTAWLSAAWLVRLHGHVIDMSDDDAFSLVMEVASSRDVSVVDVANGLTIRPVAP